MSVCARLWVGVCSLTEGALLPEVAVGVGVPLIGRGRDLVRGRGKPQVVLLVSNCVDPGCPHLVGDCPVL